MGWRHILFIDEEHHGLYSWGDSTFGQTGNDQKGDLIMKDHQMSRRAGQIELQLLGKNNSNAFKLSKSLEKFRESFRKVRQFDNEN